MILIYFNWFIFTLLDIVFKILKSSILLLSSFINYFNWFKLVLYFELNSSIKDINNFDLSFYIESINSYNYDYFSLLLNPSIYFSYNFNIILKNDIPKENISHNSGLN